MRDHDLRSSSELPACRHRGDRITEGRWECSSRKLVLPGRVIDGEFCRNLCPYVDHPEEESPPVQNLLPDDLHPEMSEEAFLAEIETDSRHFPEGWQDWTVAQLVHRRLFQEACQNGATTGPGTKSGRGIVIGAGGEVYFRCAWVVVKLLRELGCHLPVEFWHLGPREMDREMIELVGPLGVTCHDAREISPQPRRLGGWELKPFSMIHSRFREVLYLDADNLPLCDPAPLFDSAEYREHGALFWPDLPPDQTMNSLVRTLTWDVAGISWRGGPAFETGQMLIDTVRCWQELQLCLHLNEHSDFWYRYVYGDKDTFKLAWHKRETVYAMPDREPQWVAPSIRQFDPSGKPVFAHACQGKDSLIDGLPIPHYPLSRQAVAAAGQLAAAWSHVRSPLRTWNPYRPEILRFAQQEPCCHRGKELRTETDGHTEAAVFRCEQHGECTLNKLPGSSLAACGGCDDFLVTAPEPPSRLRQIHGLSDKLPYYNGSIIRYQDRMILVYRMGEIGSTLWLAELSETLEVLSNRELNLPRIAENQLGCEDPRAFIYRGRLHVSYSGLETREGSWKVNMLYGSLTDDYRVQDHYALSYVHRNPWEKNWQFFEYEDDLYCVYEIAPHTILKVEGAEAVHCYQEEWPILWKRGSLRGGAPPCQVGDEFYTFFHGMDQSTRPPTYTLGCYTFEAHPPFRPLRCVQEPLLSPDPADQPFPGKAWCVYPCGRLNQGDRWLISYGYYDHELWLAEYPAPSLEAALVPIPQ